MSKTRPQKCVPVRNGGQKRSYNFGCKKASQKEPSINSLDDTDNPENTLWA